MFDPYHKWLGIPPKDQPPNHYRLLGIEMFEGDADVIDAAANRQMAYIQSCASGPHLALSQKLLNEIAAARVGLLDATKKSAYDTDLKAKERRKKERRQEQRRKDEVPVDLENRDGSERREKERRMPQVTAKPVAKAQPISETRRRDLEHPPVLNSPAAGAPIAKETGTAAPVASIEAESGRNGNRKTKARTWIALVALVVVIVTSSISGYHFAKSSARDANTGEAPLWHKNMPYDDDRVDRPKRGFPHVPTKPLIPPAAVIPPATDDFRQWQKVFRSDDPTIWKSEINAGPDRFARNLFNLPEDIRYLKFAKSSAEFVIIPITKQDLTRDTISVGYGWKGKISNIRTNQNGQNYVAYQFGIYDRGLQIAKDSVLVIGTSQERFTGWGFGCVLGSDTHQGYCWRGKPIEKTVFEISVKSADLTDDEQKALAANLTWLTIFRSMNPEIWNRDVRTNQGFALALHRIPDEIRYLKLARTETDFVIVPISKAKLTQKTADGKIGWEGTGIFAWKAHRLGVFCTSWTGEEKGTISVAASGQKRFRGWGFGVRNFMDDKQGYTWASAEIPPTVFEIGVKAGDLTEEERKNLLTEDKITRDDKPDSKSPIPPQPSVGDKTNPSRSSEPSVKVEGRWRHNASYEIRLLPNGAINTPESGNTWSVDGRQLTLKWAYAKAPGGFFVDSCVVSEDGQSYSGKNQKGAEVTGKRLGD